MSLPVVCFGESFTIEQVLSAPFPYGLTSASHTPRVAWVFDNKGARNIWVADAPGFVPGQVTRGQITYPGYEHIRFEAVVQKIESERLFSFIWHPYAVDPDEDYSAEAPTLVEFTLEKSARGTLLRVVESGFDKLPSKRRLEAFRMNEGGWDEQLGNISRHLAHAA